MITKRRIASMLGALMLVCMLLAANTQTVDAAYYHTVTTGDTLSGIAYAYGTTVSDIMAYNPHLVNPHYVWAGDVLYIPSYGGLGYGGGSLCRAYHTVSYGQTLSGIAAWYGTGLYHLAATNGIAYYNYIYAGQVLCIPW